MTSKWQTHTRTDLAKFSSYLHPEKTNLLCPSGIGDLYWIHAKFRVFQSESIFWFPGEENHRAAALADMLGIEYGFMPKLTTDWVWSKLSDQEYVHRKTLVVHANRHLESGNHIKEWCPDLPLDFADIRSGFRPPIKTDYICMFACSTDYMGGQLHATVWANMIKCIMQSTGMKVVLIGAGADVPLIREIIGTYPSLSEKVITVLDRSFSEVLGWLQGCNAFISVASGFSIIATCLGIPSITAYPRHLDLLPGTFEPESSLYDWVFLDQLPEYIFSYKHNNLAMSGGTHHG